MFGVKFISSTSSSNWPPELGHRPSLRPTPVSPSNADPKLQHYRVDRRHIAAGHFHERPPSPSSWPGSMPLWPVGEHNEIHPPWTRSECAHSSSGFWPAQAKDESAKKPA